jgi:hypothetical protein
MSIFLSNINLCLSVNVWFVSDASTALVNIKVYVMCISISPRGSLKDTTSESQRAKVAPGGKYGVASVEMLEVVEYGVRGEVLLLYEK